MRKTICPNCQKGIPPDSRLCPYCGIRITAFTAPGKHSGMGIASFVLGVLAAAFWWIPFIIRSFTKYGDERFAFLWWMVLLFPMAVISITFGALGYFGKSRDTFGLAGLILSCAILVISLVFMILTGMILQ
jgi:hypothetical protein